MFAEARQRRTARAGFTLIELLLVLALASLICVGLYAIHDGALRVVEAVDAMAGHDETRRTATFVLRNDLLSVYYRKWGEQPQDSPLRFVIPSQGQRRKDPRDDRDVVILEFAAAVTPLFDKASGAWRIARLVYALRPLNSSSGDGEVYALVRKELPYAGMRWRSPTAEPWSEMVVADKVSSVAIRTFRADNTEAVGWDSLEMEKKGRPPLPATVVIEVARPGTDLTASWSTSIAMPLLELSFDREPS